MTRRSHNPSGDSPKVLLLTAEISSEVLELPGLRQLWDRWNAERTSAGGRVPARRSIDVLDLRDCLGNLILLDVVDGGRDFRYRVHGTNIAVAFDQDLTGRLMSSLPPEEARFFLRLYRRVCREQIPIFCRRRINAGVRMQLWDRLAVPLSSNGDQVDQIMTAAFARPDNEAIEPDL